MIISIIIIILCNTVQNIIENAKYIYNTNMYYVIDYEIYYSIINFKFIQYLLIDKILLVVANVMISYITNQGVKCSLENIFASIDNGTFLFYNLPTSIL